MNWTVVSWRTYAQVFNRTIGRWLLRQLGIAVVVVIALILATVIFQTVWHGYTVIQDRQEWALVAVVAGGDPIELARFSSHEACEAKRKTAGLENYARGFSVGLRCQGIKSWLELLHR